MPFNVNPSTSRLRMGIEAGDAVSIGGVRYLVDVVSPALIAPGGTRRSLADGAVVEVVPGFFAQVVDWPRLGPFVLAFWGISGVRVVRRRRGEM